MTSSQIRQSFLDFFKSKQHTIVPSSPLMPDSPNLLFTNAGMNQFVPIFLGQVKCPYTPGRAADTQKCIRAGGKHNDLDDVGLDTYHHTFFEMLGNWSFGDYFKKEAIDWAWELVVGIWKFPPQRLYATVYSPDKSKNDPSEFDQDAWNFWAEKFRAIGLDPAVHIVHGSKKDNFWMMGDTGPCGPCSELHVDLTPAGDTKGSLVNKGDARCIEIWNLVFIQFNANPDGSFSPLPAKHVDTGMGFERVTSIIQGTKGFTDFANARISNYETDIFRPIFDELEKLSGKRYGSTLPTAMGSTGDPPVPPGDPPGGMGAAADPQRGVGLEKGAPPHSAGLGARQDGPVARSTQTAPGATYSRRNFPHFEKPWAIYHVIINVIAPRKLSPAARDVVFDCILHWRDSRYRLVAACVMPDHAHFIIQPGVKEEDKAGNPIFWPLSEILHSIKSYSAKEVNKLDNVKGTLWQEERYDRYMRSDADLEEKFHYVCRNPWAAGALQESEPWPWLWTPDIEARQPYVSMSVRKCSTGDPPVPPGDPPGGMGATSVSKGGAAGLQKDAPSHSAGLVAQRHGPVARSTLGTGSTGDPPVPPGDPPGGMGATADARRGVDLEEGAPLHSAGLVARQDGPVARSTQEQVAIDIAFRVIADHIRTLSFAIADGIQPGIKGRNGVLRSIHKRMVRYASTIGVENEILLRTQDKLVDTLAISMGDFFPEVRARKEHIKEVLRQEADVFNKTLARGIEIFEGALAELSYVKHFLKTVPTRLNVVCEELNQLSDAPITKERVESVHAAFSLSILRGPLTSEFLDSFEKELSDAPARTGATKLVTIRWSQDWSALWKPVSEMFVDLEDLTQQPNAFAACIQKIHNACAQIRNELNTVDESLSIFPGHVAFKLYDTYGFPLDLTELLARERGLTVDKVGFDVLMEKQKNQSRITRVTQVIELSQINTATPTKFIGYDKLETPANVLEVVSLKDKTAVILDTSACYAEMGGQVGDTGELTGSGQLWRITNTQKSGNTWLHFIQEGAGNHERVAQATSLSRPATGRTEREGASISGSSSELQSSVTPVPVGGSPTGTGESPVLPVPGSAVSLSVDRPRRHAIERHHTVTHLLHWALHEVASRDASQKGSFVGPDKLTFDFNSAPLTPQQLADIEKLVNERILENAPVSWTEVPHAEVKNRKDVMQFFGDKYGDTVRVVQVGGRAGGLDGYSMELCGGTHTRATGEIGLFRITGENAIAAGVRRIEAIAGLEAYSLANQQLQLIRSVASKINSPVHELEKKIELLLDHQKELEKQVRSAMQRNASNAASELLGRVQTLNGIPCITHNLGDADGDFLQAIADALKSRFKGLVVLGGLANNAVALVATVSAEFTARVQAGKIIQAIAPIVGGKGGGKPENARGGGKDAGNLDEALAKVRALLV